MKIVFMGTPDFAAVALKAAGKKVVLRIPPGTQPGRKFRIKGQGLEKNGRKGDQLVGVQVTLPEKLSPEQEELMKKLAESAGMAY